MFNQYMRDFMEDNPTQSLENVRKYWLLKKQRPMKNGFVKYQKSDLNLQKKVALNRIMRSKSQI